MALVYACDNCGNPTPRDQLTVKRVQFRQMGSEGKVIATRAVGWLCPPCLEDDPIYQMEKYENAPGTAAKRVPLVTGIGP